MLCAELGFVSDCQHFFASCQQTHMTKCGSIRLYVE